MNYTSQHLISDGARRCFCWAGYCPPFFFFIDVNNYDCGKDWTR